MKFQCLLLLLCGATACSANFYQDRPCGTNMENLWLDVVAVVDSSQGMTVAGLKSIAAIIGSIFGGSQIGANPTNPRTTRVGLITYDYEARVIANLTTYRSIDDLILGLVMNLTTTSSNTTSLVALGLQAARDLLFKESFNTERGHYKKVIIVFASAYKRVGKDDPKLVADRLKTRGVKIITVAYDQDGDAWIVEQLSKIASEGLSFKYKPYLVEDVQNALLKVNCFCPSHCIQYRTSFSSYATCIQPVGRETVWHAAKISCASRWNNTYLASEFNQEKHDFIFNTVKTTNIIFPPYKYHIGLNRESGVWQWEQPTGKSHLAVREWVNWGQGYPMGSSGMSVGMNVENGQGWAEWRNVGPMNSAASYRFHRPWTTPPLPPPYQSQHQTPFEPYGIDPSRFMNGLPQQFGQQQPYPTGFNNAQYELGFGGFCGYAHEHIPRDYNGENFENWIGDHQERAWNQIDEGFAPDPDQIRSHHFQRRPAPRRHLQHAPYVNPRHQEVQRGDVEQRRRNEEAARLGRAQHIERIRVRDKMRNEQNRARRQQQQNYDGDMVIRHRAKVVEEELEILDQEEDNGRVMDDGIVEQEEPLRAHGGDEHRIENLRNRNEEEPELIGNNENEEQNEQLAEEDALNEAMIEHDDERQGGPDVPQRNEERVGGQRPLWHDIAPYTTVPPPHMTRSYHRFLAQRATELLQRDPPPRDGPLSVFISAQPTRMTVEETLAYVAWHQNVPIANWTHYESRLSLFKGTEPSMEHIFRVTITERCELPFSRDRWTMVFSAHNLLMRKGHLFHTLSHSELVRYVVLATWLQICPENHQYVSQDYRKAIGRLDHFRAAGRVPEVQRQINTVLNTRGQNRLTEEYSFIAWSEEFEVRHPEAEAQGI